MRPRTLVRESGTNWFIFFYCKLQYDCSLYHDKQENYYEHMKKDKVFFIFGLTK